MRHLLILTLVLMFTASLAFAQAGSIGLFADLTGDVCNINEPSGVTFDVNVVYVNHGGGTACQFSAPTPACLLATYLSDITVFSVNIGDSQNGISIGFGACEVAPTHVLSLRFFGVGATGDCCYFKVLPHPDSEFGEIEATDCAFISVFPTGGEAIINPTASCDCNVANETSTWGKVKALYAE